MTSAPLITDWPLFGYVDDIRPLLRRNMDAGRPVAVITIVALEGGGPRPVGAQMLVADDAVAGFLSGGCVEADVIGHAHACLTDGVQRRLVYGAGSPWFDIRLLCGVRMELLVERILPDDAAMRRLLQLTEARRPARLVTDGSCRRCDEPNGLSPDLDDGSPSPGSSADRFQRDYEPPFRLFVVGHDPTAMAIASLGAQAGFESSILRRHPVSQPPLPQVRLYVGHPADAILQLEPDYWTAIAIATHDDHLDSEAVRAGLSGKASYVGLLGSRRRLEALRRRLRNDGILDDTLARLRAPIGLPLGGKAPWEIAISVIGDIIATRYEEKKIRSDQQAHKLTGERGLCAL